MVCTNESYTVGVFLKCFSHTPEYNQVLPFCSNIIPFTFRQIPASKYHEEFFTKVTDLVITPTQGHLNCISIQKWMAESWCANMGAETRAFPKLFVLHDSVSLSTRKKTFRARSHAFFWSFLYLTLKGFFRIRIMEKHLSSGELPRKSESGLAI